MLTSTTTYSTIIIVAYKVPVPPSQVPQPTFKSGSSATHSFQCPPVIVWFPLWHGVGGGSWLNPRPPPQEPSSHPNTSNCHHYHQSFYGDTTSITITIAISGASASLPPGLLPIHKNLPICDFLPTLRLPRTASSPHAEQVFIGISAVGNAHSAIFLGPLNLLCLKVDRCSMQIICCPIHITWQSADERMAVWLPKLYSFAKSLALGCDRLQNILSKNPMQGQFQAIKMAHRLFHWGSKSVQLVQCTLYNWSREAPPPKNGIFWEFFPKKGGGGLLKSQNFCKFTKCFFVCKNHS